MKKNCTPHVCKWIINQFFNWVTDEPHYTTKVKNIKRLCWKNSLTVRLIYHSTYQKVTKRKHFFIFLWILFNLEKCSGIDHQTFFCNSSGNTVFSTKILTHKMWRRATAAKKKGLFQDISRSTFTGGAYFSMERRYNENYHCTWAHTQCRRRVWSVSLALFRQCVYVLRRTHSGESRNTARFSPCGIVLPISDFLFDHSRVG